ncbi:MAG: response regulator [Bacteroidetes bacterium]|nr:response regulator [Bacteroidota bacterium]
MKKSYVFEIKIAVLLMIVVGTVSITGWLAYQRLSAIAETLNEEARPNDKLLIITDISSRMADAESSISTYTLTSDRADLSPYHETLSIIDEKIQELYALTKNNDDQTAQIDSINQLIKQKLWIWDEMLTLKEDNRVEKALNELSEKLVTKVDTQITETRKGFFQRIFSSQKTVVDTVIHEIKAADVQSEVDTLEQKENIHLARRKSKELQLIRQNRRITKEMNEFIARFETAERLRIAEKTAKADALAAETNRYITFFSITTALLLLLVFLIIINYVRKSNAYQRALQKARKEAEDLSAAKERFVANMSHEIRTPMNAIIGFTKQLIRQNKDHQMEEPLQMIDHAGEHLLQMINDILDTSKLNTGNLNIEKIDYDPAELMDSIHKLFEPLTRDKLMDFTHDCAGDMPKALMGDPFRLKQIVMNLVSNAIKFTTEGYVHLSAWTGPMDNTTVALKIMIVDTGIGIPKDKQHDIFSDFTQAAQNTTRLYGGTGLGLSIVKKLVELQNGQIELSSHLNEGTEFIVTIPQAIGDTRKLEKTVKETIPDTHPLKNTTILLADDEEYNRRLITFILKNRDVPYKEVSNGEEALYEIRQNHYDIVLMDVRMPIMDGLTATKNIRELKHNSKAHIPVIAITAGNSQKEIEECRNAGMNSFITKPFTEENLFRSILQLLPPQKIPTKVINEQKPDQTETDNQKSEPTHISLQELNRMAGGDEKFVHEMLQMFVSNSQRVIIEIEKNLASGNMQDIGEEAHKMASPCRHLGLTQLVSQIKQLEKEAFENQDKEAISKLFTTVKTGLMQTCRHIEQDILSSR